MLESPRFHELGKSLVPMQGDVNSTNEKSYFDSHLEHPAKELKVLTGAPLHLRPRSRAGLRLRSRVSDRSTFGGASEQASHSEVVGILRLENRVSQGSSVRPSSADLQEDNESN